VPEDHKTSVFGKKGLIGVIAGLWGWVSQRPHTHPDSVEKHDSSMVRNTRQLLATLRDHNKTEQKISQRFQTGTRALQLSAQGSGTLNHRCYSVKIRNTKLGASELIHSVALNFSKLSPSELADFDKTKGKSWVLKIGDEFDITMLGPWNGAVRVVEMSTNAFVFATLQGHPEAGIIRFAAKHGTKTDLEFEISSTARSRDAVVDVAYQGGGKGVQLATWLQFLEGVVKLSGGVQVGQIHTVTEELPADQNNAPKTSRAVAKEAHSV
jgi:Domain of unknown function (DUF1990)